MRWYLPSFAGDFRLEPISGTDDRAVLIIQKPTLAEGKMLRAFLGKARKKKWTGEDLPKPDVEAYRAMTVRRIELDASVAAAGVELAKHVRPKDRTITAIKYEGGKLQIAEGVDHLLEVAAKEAEAAGATAAVSVARPTPCCPQCYEDAIGPATEVLSEYMSPEQHADWARERAMIVIGGYTGRRYLLAHRNSATAAKIGKICYGLDDRVPLHFHDTFLPPEEEVLAAKLILEHREDWLRNEATLFARPWQPLVHALFKNPFGDVTDGVADSTMTSAIGGGLLGSMIGQALQQ